MDLRTSLWYDDKEATGDNSLQSPGWSETMWRPSSCVDALNIGCDIRLGNLTLDRQWDCSVEISLDATRVTATNPRGRGSTWTTDSLLPQYGGGGVFAAQFDSNWIRSIYHIDTYLGVQKLVLNITFCGDWAGVPVIYHDRYASSGTVGVCHGNNVIEAGNPQYGDAYCELNYIKVYSLEGASLLSSSSQNYLSPSSGISTGAALTSATSTAVASATA
ncbi:glycoside hydrolase family 16 protein [Athelia psychrophila]|uniref:Glycoside hydrolase family 16 protein n=1 Tax=Athelia psychrophila TaxID=1759441 RepID=A0A166B3V6_9AGAM|nr:glycoside hydrolase family 16 protein [Fibularhizoctonia sp. CBS 109695]